MEETITRAYKKRERLPKKQFGGKRPIKQKIWDYIRRNKEFNVREILVLLDVNMATLRAFLYPLMIAGCIRKVGNERNFKDASFVFIAKESEIYASLVSAKEVYLYGAKMSCDIGARAILKSVLKYKSQREVGAALGVSGTTINLLLSNKYPNPAPIYKKIRAVL